MAISRSLIVKTSEKSSLPSRMYSHAHFERRRRNMLGRPGSRHDALLRVLRETSSLEARGLGVKDPPFLAKSIPTVEDSLNITGKPASLFEVAHQSDTLT
jgi:hypothetical protein